MHANESALFGLKAKYNDLRGLPTRDRQWFINIADQEYSIGEKDTALHILDKMRKHIEEVERGGI